MGRPAPAGRRCTERAAEQYRRPYIFVNIDEPIDLGALQQWITLLDAQVLNVAGHRESMCPGITQVAEHAVFALCTFIGVRQCS